MTKAENVIVIGLLFAFLMSLYGVSVGNAPSVTNTTNQLLSGPPSFAGTFALKACSWYDINCINGNVATATAAIALAAEYPAIFVFWFFNKIGLFFGFVATAILGPQQGANSTPFLALFFGFLLIYPLFEILRIFRGNSTAGV
jgi:hypothetical protein